MTDATAHYTVLARRYRPQTFADVIGQQHVAQALRNAIQGERVAHAYLFTGARGVGKTSMARILAKALNCPNAVEAVPCNDCEICTGIAHGSDVDVLEIDGASNRGIDDIRQLRANVNVKSMRTKFKLYIIDEVHMLTKEAFNALLKTLEEPPPNVKFVFCTTEPNKLPDTILSRCQRFDFATIETQSIMERLHSIAEAEGFTVKPDALELVARRAAGSMRDSQSLFDQLLAFGSDEIGAEDVHRLLGTASDDRIIDLADALVQRDRAAVLDRLNTALGEGVQLDEFIGQLVDYCRDLMVISAGADAVSLLSVAAANRDRLKAQADAWGLETVVAAMEILAEAKARMSRVTFGRAIAEMSLIRVSLLQDMAQIDQLVQALNSGAVRPGDPTQKKTPHVADQPSDGGESPPAAVGNVQSTPPVALKPTASNVGQATDADSAGTKSPDFGSSVSGSAATVEQSRSSAPNSTAETELAQKPTASEPHVVGDPSVAFAGANSVPSELVARPANVPESPLDTSETPEPTPEAPEIYVELQLGNEKSFLTQLVDSFDDMTATHVRGVSNLAISGPNGIELAFPKGYHFSKTFCERPEVKSGIEQAASRIAGKQVRVNLHLLQDDAETAPKPKPQVSSQRIKHPEPDDYVKQAVELFGATIVKVEGISAPAVAEDSNP